MGIYSVDNCRNKIKSHSYIINLNNSTKTQKETNTRFTYYIKKTLNMYYVKDFKPSKHMNYI